MTGLANEASGNERPPVDSGAGGDDKVFSDHITPNVYRIMFVAVDAAVLKLHCTCDHGVCTNTHVLDIAHIDNLAASADGASVGSMFVAIVVDDCFHPLN